MAVATQHTEGLMLDQIICGDALEVLPTLPDNSVSLIVTDPPYYKVKKEAWDRQWSSPEEYLAWLGGFCEEWHRLLKPNGSLYCFASPQMAARVECLIAESFTVVNRITWRKGDFDTKAEMFRKSDLRGYFPASEAIIFAEHQKTDDYEAKCDELRGVVFEPLRAYLDREREQAGVSKLACNVACGFAPVGGMAQRKYFSQSQWQLPTKEHYLSLRQLFNSAGTGHYLQYEYGDLREQYIYLWHEYEEARQEYEKLRRPFTVTADVPYTDVWDFPTVKHYPGKHPCEKPLAMIEHIIKASSREGDVVLDNFAGSGAVGEACRNLGRQYILIEREQQWCDVANDRLGRRQLAL